MKLLPFLSYTPTHYILFLNLEKASLFFLPWANQSLCTETTTHRRVSHHEDYDLISTMKSHVWLYEQPPFSKKNKFKQQQPQNSWFSVAQTPHSRTVADRHQFYEMLYIQICPAKSNRKFAVGRNRERSSKTSVDKANRSLFSIVEPFFILYSQRKEGRGKEERAIRVYSLYQRVLYNPCFGTVFLSIHQKRK